jgi:hypothetical protein
VRDVVEEWMTPDGHRPGVVKRDLHKIGRTP